MSAPDRNVIPQPPNATRLEVAYAQSGAALLNQPIPIDRLWDAWRCPAAFLPFLAYALSVDFWDDGWDEIRKRKTIDQSPAYHRRKGTRLAVEEAMATLGVDYDISEWWEVSPQRRRGTARILIPIAVPNAAALVPVARQRVYAAKPKSRAVHIGIGEWTGGTLFCGGVIHSAITTLIEPYRFQNATLESHLGFGGAVHSDITTLITETPQ